MDRPIKWAARLEHVREVSLLGTADLTYWTDRLREEGLNPVERDGRALLLIVAADSKYMGIRFRELSFSVLVARPDDRGTPGDAALLIRAYNSCRLFAFAERVFFATPYDHADVRVSVLLPASIQLTQNGEVAFRAQMAADDSGAERPPVRCREEGWEGPVFMPRTRRGKCRRGSWFVARLRGDTRAYPFLPSRDRLVIRPSADRGVFRALRESDFAATEWIIRADAAHAKSRTYPRTDELPGVTRE